MSIKKLFQQSKESKVVGKYLKKSAIADLSGGMESAQHLDESIIRRGTFTPPLDYGDPKQFAKYGSAKKYYENAFNYITNNYPFFSFQRRIYPSKGRTTLGNSLLFKL